MDYQWVWSHQSASVKFKNHKIFFWRPGRQLREILHQWKFLTIRYNYYNNALLWNLLYLGAMLYIILILLMEHSHSTWSSLGESWWWTLLALIASETDSPRDITLNAAAGSNNKETKVIANYFQFDYLTLCYTCGYSCASWSTDDQPHRYISRIMLRIKTKTTSYRTKKEESLSPLSLEPYS